MTRSLKVRCLVDNPENKLKLEMYVNVKIEYDLGEKLAVPQEAVMHTGTSDIVFVADPNGYFESRVVTLGAGQLITIRCLRDFRRMKKSSRPATSLSIQNRN